MKLRYSVHPLALLILRTLLFSFIQHFFPNLGKINPSLFLSSAIILHILVLYHEIALIHDFNRGLHVQALLQVL